MEYYIQNNNVIGKSTNMTKFWIYNFNTFYCEIKNIYVYTIYITISYS